MAVDTELSLPFFLVATPQLTDPHFAKTVVLVVENDENGTLGFIVNRPIGIKLKELVGRRDYEIPHEVTGWYGGPVKTDTGIVLSCGELDSQASRGVVLSSAERALKQLAENARERLDALRGGEGRERVLDPLYPFRFLIGYAGWGAGQLGEELKEGAWIQVPYCRNLLYDTSWKTLWERALLGVGVNPRQLVAPQQPFLN